MAAPIVAAGVKGAATSSAAGGSAGSAAGTSKAAQAVGVAQGASSFAGESLSPLTNIVSMIQARKARKTQQNQFDRTFKENERRWGLEWALKEWSVRKSVAADEAAARYNQEMGRRSMALQGQQVGSQLETEALNRQGAETTMRWAREDREKAAKMSKAYSRGLIGGILGRKK